MPKKDLRKHATILENAHDNLAEMLPHHRASFWEKYEWPLLIAGWVLVLAGFGWVFYENDEQNNPEPQNPTPPILEPQNTHPELAPKFASRLGVASTVLSRRLAQKPPQNPLLRTPNLTPLGNELAQKSVDNFVKVENAAISTALHLGQWLDTKSNLGADSAQQSLVVATHKTHFEDDAARFTQILAEIRAPLSKKGFGLGKITNPPTEIQKVRADFVQKVQKGAVTLGEIRQIELNIKGNYQKMKSQQEKLGKEIGGMIDQNQAPVIPESSSTYQEIAAATARLQAQFKIFNKLEVDFRKTNNQLQQRINYIDKFFNDLALGLCDWGSC